MQAKRIAVFEENKSAGQATEVSLIVPTSPREQVNFHNIWGSVSAEPQTADANCQGTWILFVRRVGQISVTYTDTNVNNETQNQYIIACGIYSASNQAPYTISVHPETSRTLEAGDSLVLQLVVTGISAGAASVRCMLCAHTTRK